MTDSGRTPETDLAANKAFYDPLWSSARLISPDRFNTWDLVRQLSVNGVPRLEVAPGLRPRLPLQDTLFVDLSRPAVHQLQSAGARALVGQISQLPFDDDQFGFCCAFDIVEHVDDDQAAFSELARVTRPQGQLLLSVPLHMAAWTGFDDFVGHRRRYEPDEIIRRLEEHGFRVRHSAVFGMRPKSSWLLEKGMWFLNNQPDRAMWWYNQVFMPIGLRFQKALDLREGLIDTEDVGEILLVCEQTG